MVKVEINDTHFYMSKYLANIWRGNNLKVTKKDDDDRVFLVDGGEGCLAGDTMIQCSRGKLSRRYSIKRLYNHYNGNPDKIIQKGKTFDMNIPTYVRSFNGKDIRLHKINDVMYSGKKMTYLLTLENGKQIKATKTHKFLSIDGWKELQDLKKGDKLMCDTLNAKGKGRKRVKLYDIQLKVYYHRSGKNRVEVHRLIYEAHMNNMDFLEYMDILLNEPEISKGLKYVDPDRYEIHHKDGCHYNNSIDNLEMLSQKDHLRKHDNNYSNFSQGQPSFSRIESIEELEVEDVYDISCDDPYHNFVANGIVVHNSGKSLWTIQQMAYLDPSAFDSPEEFVSRIVFSAEDFQSACRNFKNKVIIFDEAFRGFASRSAMSKVNKKLVQTLMEMRQNNNIVFIVLPSFFLLDIYPAMLRSNGLFNIFKRKKDKARMWRVYNKRDKNNIFQQGTKKGWSYNVKARMYDRFFGNFPGGDAFQRAYLAKKAKSFTEEDRKNDDDKRDTKIKKMWLGFLYYLSVHGLRIPTKDLRAFFEDHMKSMDLPVTLNTISGYASDLKKNDMMPDLEAYMALAKVNAGRKGIDIASYDNSFIPEPPLAETKILEVDKPVPVIHNVKKKPSIEKIAETIKKQSEVLYKVVDMIDDKVPEKEKNKIEKIKKYNQYVARNITEESKLLELEDEYRVPVPEKQPEIKSIMSNVVDTVYEQKDFENSQ